MLLNFARRIYVFTYEILCLILFFHSFIPQMLGWPKSLLHFSCKIKEIFFFIFTNNFIDLDILSMLAISHYWILVGRGQGCC